MTTIAFQSEDERPRTTIGDRQPTADRVHAASASRRLEVGAGSPRRRRDTIARSRSVERARPRGVDRDDRGDAARPRRHHDDAVGEEDRLGDAVGDDHDRRAVRSHSASSSRLNRSRVSASSALNGSSRSSTSRLRARGPGRSPRAGASRPTAGWAAASRASLEADEVEQLAEPRVAPLARPAGELERVRDVVGDRPPRQQPRLLEHEPDPRVRAGDRRGRRA